MKIVVDGENLEGDLICPDNAKGLVLFAHGSGSSHLSPRNQFVARRLNEEGFATFLFDLLTKHEELVDLKGGTFRFNIPFLTDRLLKATSAIRKEKSVADLPFGYFGASTGGACALCAATYEQPFAIVIRGGRPDMAFEDLKKVEAPTLMLVGSLDGVVIQLNQKAYRELRCEKQLKLIEGATHLFEEEGTLEAMTEQAVDWFKSHLPLKTIF